MTFYDNNNYLHGFNLPGGKYICMHDATTAPIFAVVNYKTGLSMTTTSVYVWALCCCSA